MGNLYYALNMISWFMIEFKYLGKSHFANVFEYGSSPLFYHVQFINWRSPTGDKLVLKKTNTGIELSASSETVHEELLESIIQEIAERRKLLMSNL